MDETDLLSSFARGRAPRPPWAGLLWSASAHGIVVGAVGAAAFLGPLRPSEPAGESHVPLFFNPAPPPAPQLPLGSAGVPRVERPRPLTPAATVETARLVVPPEEVMPPREAPPEPVVGGPAVVQAGDPNGGPNGVPEGMENGSPDGVPGGVPDGRPGGEPGGTGKDVRPVRNYDRGPRLVRQTKPSYPHDAFIKKIEGEVLLEILIDSSGYVAGARVIRSIPLLDAQAIQTVYEWRFEPAVKHGRPVPTLAHASVRFSLI